MSNKSYLRRIAELRPRDRFIYYINERLEIKHRRDDKLPKEQWTKDPILAEYKFTNVRRAWDYTSQWLLHNWYEPHGNSSLCGMAAAFARFFPYVPTLEAVGFPETGTGSKAETHIRHWFDDSRKILATRQDRGIKIFSSAYIIGGIGSMRKSDWVITKFLTPVLESGILFKSWDDVNVLHANLHAFSGWGHFMTQEVVLDLMDTFVLKDIDPTQKREYGWAGPGAIRGLNRVYGREVDQRIGPNAAQLEMRMLWEYMKKDEELDSQLRRSLTVHDVEFNLCEFDKYSRALLGEGTPKQKFVPRNIGEAELAL